MESVEQSRGCLYRNKIQVQGNEDIATDAEEVGHGHKVLGN